MGDTVAGRAALLLAYAALALLFSVRAYRSVRKRGWTRIFQLPARNLLAVTFLAGGVLCSVLKPAPPWAPALTMILLTYGVLVAYVIAVEMLEDRPLPVFATWHGW